VRFDLTTLRVFVGAIDHGSIAKAADREHIVASAASKRIAELEAGLGVALLVRQHGGVIATAAGEALARQAREVIRTLDQIPEALNTLAAEEQPDIGILGNQTGIVVVLEDLAGYLAQRPAVHVRLEERQSLAIIESVAEGSADIGIIGHFQPTDRLHVVPYRSVPLMLVVASSHPLAAREAVPVAAALEFDLITLVQGTAIRGWLLATAARMARKPRFTLQVQSYEAMRAMVRAGLGVAVMPAPNVVPYESLLQLRAIPLTDEWASMQLFLCAQRTGRRPAVDELIAMLAGERATR
jgi:DNA-binding transcriptional LysR family regulator